MNCFQTPSETWSCPLPVPNSFAHVTNAQENSVLGNRLKVSTVQQIEQTCVMTHFKTLFVMANRVGNGQDIGQQIRSKVQDFGVFMGGANGFMEEFNTKVQAVMCEIFFCFAEPFQRIFCFKIFKITSRMRNTQV